MAKISISEAAGKPDFKISKEEGVLAWLLEFRKKLLESGHAALGDIIPGKKELAEYLGVSTGTVQNALKHAEDQGFFTSKQRIGTMISNPEDKNGFKMFSKKDKAHLEIKKYLVRRQYKENEIIPGVCAFAKELKTSANTVRLAVFELLQKKILRKETCKKNTVLILNCTLNGRECTANDEIKSRNLPKILKEDIKKYLNENFKTGDKIPTNSKLAKMYGVSARTINSALRELNREKVILSRRGNYGSVYLNKSRAHKKAFISKPAGMPKKAYNYKWEAAMENIVNYILKNHKAGDKIASMEEFAKRLNISTSTVKRAVEELYAQGILFAQKGKYGGLFILEMPQKEDSYQWLAVNPGYFG